MSSLALASQIDSFAAEEQSHDSDRRGSARAPLFTLVQTPGAGQSLWARDIGLGGMLCQARKPRFPGTYLDLSFKLPGTGDALEIGSQVITLDQLPDRSLSMGLRFCMLSSKAERLIYRFLDQRRFLWSKDAAGEYWAARKAANQDGLPRLVTDPQRELAMQWAFATKRPFEHLLLEAYAALRAKELRQIGFLRSISSQKLPRLSDIAGEPIA